VTLFTSEESIINLVCLLLFSKAFKRKFFVKRDYYKIISLHLQWHLGYYKLDYTPTRRGFDTHFGVWNGKSDYFSHYDTDWGVNISTLCFAKSYYLKNDSLWSMVTCTVVCYNSWCYHFQLCSWPVPSISPFVQNWESTRTFICELRLYFCYGL